MTILCNIAKRVILRQNQWMQPTLVNLVELAHAVQLLDRIAPKRIVDDALGSAGLDRSMLASGNGFISYASEAVVLECVARAIGDRNLGARIGESFDYSAYGAYARYVLGAPDLGTALERGRRALVLTHPGSEILFRETETHLVVGRDSKNLTLTGHRHLDEGALFVIRTMVRHFLGSTWTPDWVELPEEAGSDIVTISEMIGAPIYTGADAPSIAIRLSELAARNPRPDEPTNSIPLDDLASLMGIEPAQTLEATVMQVFQIRLPLGIASEGLVARHLSLGRRSLQRALRAEGTTFRRVRARFIEAHAKELVAETKMPIGEISVCLGYREPKSFRRAFKTWTGLSPSKFRASHACSPKNYEGAAR